MTTALLPRGRVELAALILMGCQSSRHASGTLQSEAAAPPTAQPVPVCQHVWTCLGSLPHEYPSADPDLAGRVAACLGATAAERWNARSCLPFEIATDSTNGRRIEAFVTCRDVCPDYVQTGVRYVDVHQPECECLGGESIGLDDVGCAPGGVSRREGPDSFDVVGVDHYGLKAVGPFPHVRFGYLGLDRQIDSIEGRRVQDAASLRNIGRELLANPPSNVRFWASANTRVVYAERGVFDRLANEMSTLPFAMAARLPACPAPAGPGQVTVCVGDRALGCDPARDRACAGFVSDVEKAASAVGEPRVRERADCSDLRHVPTFIAVRFPNRAVELRYVDWMPRTPIGDLRPDRSP